MGNHISGSLFGSIEAVRVGLTIKLMQVRVMLIIMHASFDEKVNLDIFFADFNC